MTIGHQIGAINGCGAALEKRPFLWLGCLAPLVCVAHCCRPTPTPPTSFPAGSVPATPVSPRRHRSRKQQCWRRGAPSCGRPLARLRRAPSSLWSSPAWWVAGRQPPCRPRMGPVFRPIAWPDSPPHATPMRAPPAAPPPPQATPVARRVTPVVCQAAAVEEAPVAVAEAGAKGGISHMRFQRGSVHKVRPAMPAECVAQTAGRS